MKSFNGGKVFFVPLQVYEGVVYSEGDGLVVEGAHARILYKIIRFYPSKGLRSRLLLLDSREGLGCPLGKVPSSMK